MKPKYRKLAWIVLLACVFPAVFHQAWSFHGYRSFSYRDDAVITLSHGKNLAEYGFIGVSPSGGIVEATSSPLLTLISAATFFVAPMSYESFLDLQTWSTTAMLGVAIGLLFPIGPFALLYAIFVALALALTTRFVLWHGSGMESALLNAGMAALICLVIARLRGQLPLRDAWLGLFTAVVSVARTEAILHVGPLIGLYALIASWQRRSLKPWIAVITTLVPWGLLNAWRYWYFGWLTPASGMAQGKYLERNISRLLPSYEAYETQWAYVASTARDFFMANHIPLLLTLLVFAGPSSWRSIRAWWNHKASGDQLCSLYLVAVSAALCLTLPAHAALFGVSRLDPVRTVTFAAMICMMVLLYFIVNALKEGAWQRGGLGALAVGLGLYASVWPITQTSVRYPPVVSRLQYYERLMDAEDISTSPDRRSPTLTSACRRSASASMSMI